MSTRAALAFDPGDPAFVADPYPAYTALRDHDPVAWYEPEYGGVHNVWVAGDTLYLGAYNGGFHVFDISGELLGDLRAQGREIANLLTADRDGTMPNATMSSMPCQKVGMLTPIREKPMNTLAIGDSGRRPA
jgi:hypothetical protein